MTSNETGRVLGNRADNPDVVIGFVRSALDGALEGHPDELRGRVERAQQVLHEYFEETGL